MSEFLEVRGLTKRFRGLIANDRIDFSLAAGALRCVIGPNGAGKTTFISMISGHLEPSAGTIRFKGRDITGLSLVRRAQIGISRKFQTPTVFDNLTVVENLELAALGKPGAAAARHARIEEVLEITRLSDLARRPAFTLSHGQRQWLEVGLLLANRAELLLLDEPTAGMTSEETHATAELLHNLSDRFKLTVVIIEHDIKFIRDLRSPVTVLHLGRILMEGTFDEVSRNEQVRNVYLGTA